MSLSPLTNSISSSPIQTSTFISTSAFAIPSEKREEPKTDFQAKVDGIRAEMEKRATTLYGLNFAFAGGADKTPSLSSKKHSVENQPEPFISYFDKLFPQETIQILYAQLDPGVDDGFALVQLLAAAKAGVNDLGKKFEIVGIVPCVGNAVLNQTILNTRQFLDLTDSTGIKVYSGAIAPLAIENNQTAIDEMNQSINQTHFYGYDGEEDVGGWPAVNINVEKIPGYQYTANQILNASPESPLTLISTSSLTELSKVFTQLEEIEKEKGVSAGSFAENINAISMMGGCLKAPFGCNAPFNLPPSQKTSEANFFFDSPATQHVFTVCRKYRIPILLATLDLTQQPGLLWGAPQVDQLKTIENPVATQMARVAAVTPYLDKLTFPNDTWPNHDLQSAACLLKPQSYLVTRMAVNISSIGEIINDEQASEEEKNVYILSMASTQQPRFFYSLLNQYNHFNKKIPATVDTAKKIASILATGFIGLSFTILGGLGIYTACKKRIENSEEDTKGLIV